MGEPRSRSAETLVARRASRAGAAVVLLVVLSVATAATGTAAPPSLAVPGGVGMRVLRLVDRTRSIRLPDGRSEPRVLVTYVRYPARGSSGGGDRLRAPAAHGPFPLIVFGHGFAVTPAPYAALLRAWTRAGYVVAAPVFPLENANAPGGPDENDLVNQPADMRFVIARLIALSRAPGPLHGLIDPSRLAVAGHSDGAETALGVAYDPAHPDPRIRAAVLLSGAQTPTGGISFGPHTPALLATQGSADTINPPAITNAFFAIAPRPKFLLTLEGAAHLPPYTGEEPQLSVVERVTIAFLDAYLRHGSLRRLLELGNVPRIAALAARL